MHIIQHLYFIVYILCIIWHEVLNLADINKNDSYKQNLAMDVKYGTFNIQYHKMDFSIRANYTVNRLLFLKSKLFENMPCTVDHFRINYKCFEISLMRY